MIRTEPGGQATTVLGPGKPVAMLAYLAHLPGREASRDQLVELLWPDRAPEAARHALRQTVWFIRHRVENDLLIRTADGIRIPEGLASDRDEFVEAVERLQFDRAIEVYRGDFLERLASCGGADFEQWVDLERYRLRLLLRRTAEVASQKHLAAGRFRDANRIARHFKKYAARDYAASRLAIQVSIAVGDLITAREEADALEVMAQSTSRPLDTESQEIIARARSAEATTPRPRISVGGETIGRDQEFATAAEAWSHTVEGFARHLHYVGPPGIGKTRLLDDVGRYLVATGATVVHLRCFGHTRWVPFSLAADLVTAVGGLPGALGISPSAATTLLGLAPALGERFRNTTQPLNDEGRLRHRILATAELFEAVCDESPIALLIDETHLADPASLLLLQGTVERIASRPVLLVTTGRPTLTVFRLNLDRPTQIVPLGPLREADARQLILRHVEQPTPAREAQWLHASGGRPGALLRMVRQSHLARTAPDLEPVVQALTDSERRALLACLLNDGHLSIRMANAFTGGEAIAEFESLVQQGLVEVADGHVEIAARAVAERLYDDTDVHARAEVHRVLGRLWLAAGRYDRAAVGRAGQHFIRAGERDLLVEAYRRWVTLGRRLHPSHASALRPETFLHSSARDPMSMFLAHRVPTVSRLRRSRVQPLWVGAAGLLLGLVTGYAIADRDRGLVSPAPGDLIETPAGAAPISIPLEGIRSPGPAPDAPGVIAPPLRSSELDAETTDATS